MTASLSIRPEDRRQVRESAKSPEPPVRHPDPPAADSPTAAAAKPELTAGSSVASVGSAERRRRRGAEVREMKEVAELLEAMKASGVIADYAVFGAVAQMRYTEPVATLDADVLVTLSKPAGLDALVPIFAFCRRHGYQPKGEAIQVGDWPLQIIPAFDALTEEAVQQAEVGEIGGKPLRVVTATHLAVIALSVGRAKDHLRILALLEAGAIDADAVSALAARHGLAARWETFKRRVLDA